MPEKSICKELLASFPKTGKTDWIGVASSEVKGSNPMETLQWSPQQGLHFRPYYDKSDTQSLGYQNNFRSMPDPDSFLGQRAWYNLPPVVVNDEKSANQAALHHLMHGGDGVLFDLRKKNISFSALLEKIEWPYCKISFIVGNDPPSLEGVLNYCRNNGYSPLDVEGSIFWKEYPAITGELITASSEFKKIHTSGLFIEASSPVQEITDALVRIVNTMELWIEQSASPAHAWQNIALSIPVGTGFLVDIAKLRALRMLCYQLANVYLLTDFKPGDLYIHARSETWVNEIYQPHSNMLKSTTASIAALCGGCNSLTVYCEDESNALMQRMARNVSVVLREESHFNKVADPVAGSYAIEVMTNTFAKEAWHNFQSAMSK